jgi:hypothetical protein
LKNRTKPPPKAAAPGSDLSLEDQVEAEVRRLVDEATTNGGLQAPEPDVIKPQLPVSVVINLANPSHHQIFGELQKQLGITHLRFDQASTQHFGDLRCEVVTQGFSLDAAFDSSSEIFTGLRFELCGMHYPAGKDPDAEITRSALQEFAQECVKRALLKLLPTLQTDQIRQCGLQHLDSFAPSNPRPCRSEFVRKLMGRVGGRPEELICVQPWSDRPAITLAEAATWASIRRRRATEYQNAMEDLRQRARRSVEASRKQEEAAAKASRSASALAAGGRKRDREAIDDPRAPLPTAVAERNFKRTRDASPPRALAASSSVVPYELPVVPPPRILGNGHGLNPERIIYTTGHLEMDRAITNMFDNPAFRSDDYPYLLLLAKDMSQHNYSPSDIVKIYKENPGDDWASIVAICGLFKQQNLSGGEFLQTLFDLVNLVYRGCDADARPNPVGAKDRAIGFLRQLVSALSHPELKTLRDLGMAENGYQGYFSRFRFVDANGLQRLPDFYEFIQHVAGHHEWLKIKQDAESFAFQNAQLRDQVAELQLENENVKREVENVKREVETAKANSASLNKLAMDLKDIQHGQELAKAAQQHESLRTFHIEEKAKWEKLLEAEMLHRNNAMRMKIAAVQEAEQLRTLLKETEDKLAAASCTGTDALETLKHQLQEQYAIALAAKQREIDTLVAKHAGEMELLQKRVTALSKVPPASEVRKQMRRMVEEGRASIKTEDELLLVWKSTRVAMGTDAELFGVCKEDDFLNSVKSVTDHLSAGVLNHLLNKHHQVHAEVADIYDCDIELCKKLIAAADFVPKNI